MDDLDQECIICTLNLVVASASNYFEDARESAAVATRTESPISHPCQNNEMRAVAVIKPCNHFLHNHCLREWSQIANTCPFCRQAFNLVEVHDAVGGNIISSYPVKDKKQVAALDPGTWLQEEDEEESDPCPICNESNNPEALLLCDACDANYHTYCVGLDEVPHEDWYCMECADIGALNRPGAAAVNRTGFISRNRAPRTQATLRRTRRRLRNDNWLGPWNQIGHRIHGATGLDIDFSEDEDVTPWRQLNQNSGTEQTGRDVWRVRMNIARRQGADWTSPALSPRAPTPVESVEESMAWGEFEKAKEIDTTSPKAKKRKTRLTVPSTSESSAANYCEPQPQRKLKRPRTRRVLDQPESSSSSVVSSSLLDISNILTNESTSDLINMDTNDEPSFLSSLLREVDMASKQGDGRLLVPTTTNTPAPVTSPSLNYSSPTMSPVSFSNKNRGAVSKNTPPQIKSRSISPLPLSSRVEPVFSQAEHYPKRIQTAAPQYLVKKSSEADLSPLSSSGALLSQSSVQNEHSLAHEDSPLGTISLARTTLSGEIKRDISKIVKSALAPHWRSAEINKAQYGCINRDVSRKLYEIFAENSLDEKEIYLCEKIATAEVANALNSLRSRE